MLKEAIAPYKKTDNIIECRLCPRYCKMRPGQIGACRVRKNVEGKLFSLNYGMVTSMAIDPIEKKPLNHFWPGAPIFSISTFGCNFYCQFCQNWQISQAGPGEVPSREYTPEEIIKIAKKYKTNLIAYTYNEPIIWFEFVLDTAKLAKKEGMYNVLVTNGYITIEALEILAPYIDAANVDIKAFSDDFYRKLVFVPSVQPVLEATKYMKQHGIHVETTNLKIPGYNDNVEETREMARWIVEELGPDTPLHISRFHPDYKLRNVSSTSLQLLRESRRVAMKEGLKYVFTGNVLGDPGEHTYCPSCGKIVIKRYGFSIEEWNITDDNKCKFCGAKIDIVGKYTSSKTPWFF